ncbi:MAG: precorrin-6A/cobalt-precorrin-6A reductase, partial [Altererythrobacter sp.]|nr:precorrin-6A/cobalt-precorrin-6A reductase [Altererythrobacter sp.]
MTNVVLILGGTREAAQLAQKLAEENPKARIISSLAGRTREPKPIAGEIRIGGFGGADGLAKFIRKINVTRLIDATHPFAVNISRNAAIAAENTGIVFEIRQRAPWPKLKGDDWQEVEDLEAACAAIPAQAKVLLALGSQHIAIF